MAPQRAESGAALGLGRRFDGPVNGFEFGGGGTEYRYGSGGGYGGGYGGGRMGDCSGYSFNSVPGGGFDRSGRSGEFFCPAVALSDWCASDMRGLLRALGVAHAARRRTMLIQTQRSTHNALECT